MSAKMLGCQSESKNEHRIVGVSRYGLGRPTTKTFVPSWNTPSQTDTNDLNANLIECGSAAFDSSSKTVG